MTKIISYSLWGNSPKYNIGAIENAKLAQEIYPEWKSRFYIASSVPEYTVSSLRDIKNTEIYIKNEEGCWNSMFWRCEPCWDASVSFSVFRDTDSRISLREKYAVDEWISSKKTFHIMRDHPFHGYYMLGGMWGYKNNNKYDLETIFNSFTPSNTYGTDYDFFANALQHVIKEDKLVHDEFFEHKPFPESRIGTEFVGDVFDENNNRNIEFQRYITPQQ